MDTKSNLVDIITKGSTLTDLIQPNSFSQGPGFLLTPEEEWPIQPTAPAAQNETEVKKSFLCALNQESPPENPWTVDCLTLEGLQEKIFRLQHKDFPPAKALR